MDRICAIVLIVAAWASGAGMARADSSHTASEAIRAVAIATAGGNAVVAEARLDSRVRMAACSQPLQGNALNPRMVQVVCPDSPGWRLFVPIRLRQGAAVAVSGGTAAAAALATASNGASLEPANGGGAPAGPPLRRGDPVVLLTRIGGAEVRVPGRALGPATQDGAVSVENTGSRRIVRGRWRGGDIVEVLR